MNYGDTFSILPGEVSGATSQLAELADRVQRVMENEALSLTVQASAYDEVSQRVATTLKEVHASFTKASDQGQQQLQKVVSTVRTYTAGVVAVDQGLTT